MYEILLGILVIEPFKFFSMHLILNVSLANFDIPAIHLWTID